ncbi:hypothetical protein ONS95_014492 [Cadophora gregata]|uniref:uncharacterized protein n=1 Tax=Cadophora gregata TaxID=51156 RepID=UPI0026DAD295|nr:uncharacterized protein ONS95_014492 [Cadophora gregata]KAK0112758.1 hypothetical protein ONS95_014492 [Cadophora gregata]KAK0124890.1 hypothetical protein ONS96_008768 [Cadophora gregata f. sp. sojae]
MAIMERILIFTINICCPPLSVLLVAGPGMDCLINTLFFIAGVIPGHIHGFYVTCTYFHRKHKVKKGRYPGGRKTGIYSEEVWNGGATRRHVDQLWREEKRVAEEKEMMRVRRKEGKRGSGLGMGMGRSRGSEMVVEESMVASTSGGKKWWRP